MCSKRFLTTKVDRSVTGLVAQQQCCGPLQVPVADVAVIAQTHYGITGGATCIGEQPIKGMVDPAAMARLSLGESLTNLVFANTTGLRDVKYSGNWMYAAKLPGDGAHMFDACAALCAAMEKLDVAIDGGKDSLSMAARADGEVVKAPGSVVMSGYVTVPDVTKTVTPDLKAPGASRILLVEFGSKSGERRLGGSALAQAYGQMGDVAPDMDDPSYFKAAWEATQTLVDERRISAGHDVSDGGFVTSVLEMAFPHPSAGMDVTLPAAADGTAVAALFAEELAIFLEVAPDDLDHVIATYEAAGVTARDVGASTSDGRAVVRVGDAVAVDAAVADLRDAWEATSFALERLQSSEATVAAEEASLRTRAAPRVALDVHARADLRGGDGQSGQGQGCDSARGGQQRRPRDGRRDPQRGHGALGRHDVRFTRRRRLPRGVSRHRLRGRLFVRGRAGLRQRLGGLHQVQRAAVEPVSRLLRPPRYLLARRVQRVPADGCWALSPPRTASSRSPTPSSRALFTTTRADSRVAGSPWASTKTPPR